MHQALGRLNRLPGSTRVHCAHEYTGETCAGLRPQARQHAIAKRLAAVTDQRSRGELTLPSTIDKERDTNLFMQAGSARELAELRSLKDTWRG